MSRSCEDGGGGGELVLIVRGELSNDIVFMLMVEGSCRHEEQRLWAASSVAFSKMVVPFDGFDRSPYVKLLYPVES